MYKKINAPGILSGQMPNKWLDDRSFFFFLTVGGDQEEYSP